MSATVYQRANADERRLVTGETILVRRAADFEELFGELVEEAGRALEEGNLEWCAILQGCLIQDRGRVPEDEARGSLKPRDDPEGD